MSEAGRLFCQPGSRKHAITSCSDFSLIVALSQSETKEIVLTDPLRFKCFWVVRCSVSHNIVNADKAGLNVFMFKLDFFFFFLNAHLKIDVHKWRSYSNILCVSQ